MKKGIVCGTVAQSVLNTADSAVVFKRKDTLNSFYLFIYTFTRITTFQRRYLLRRYYFTSLDVVEWEDDLAPSAFCSHFFETFFERLFVPP